MRGGGGGGRPLLENVQKKDAFFFGSVPLERPHLPPFYLGKHVVIIYLKFAETCSNMFFPFFFFSSSCEVRRESRGCVIFPNSWVQVQDI